MKEAGIGDNQPLIPHHQAPKMTEPRKRPLHNPPPPIPSQLSAILMGRPLMITTGRDNRVDPAPGQASAQRIAIITAVGNQALGPLAGASGLAETPDRNRVEGLLEEGDFRRGSRLQVCSQRSTRAIDQNHPLRTLATFRFADLGAPFLAGMKLPSAKHSSQRTFCWSWSWARKARQSVSRTPLSSHSLSRRQQVLGLPYRRGSSLHWAPVHRIQRMPSKQRRSATRGRPPRGEALGWGRWTRIAAHCCLVNPRHAMCCPPMLLGNSWRYHTSNGRF
jgi:hypothetical protein